MNSEPAPAAPLPSPHLFSARPSLHPTPCVIGHRGMGVSHANPANPYRENTRTSFLAAWNAGATWIETDVFPSADGDLVLHHDKQVTHPDGTTTYVWDTPTERLLDTGIELLHGLENDLPPELGLYLELKVSPGDANPRHGQPSLDPLLDWVAHQAAQTVRPLLVASFNPYVIQRAQHQGLPSAWITDSTQPLLDVVLAGVQAGLSAVSVRGLTLVPPNHDLALACAIARDHDLAIWTWYPDYTLIADLIELGITGFCVDEVAATSAIVHNSLADLTTPALQG